MTTPATTARPVPRPVPVGPGPARRRGRFGVQIFLAAVSLAFLAPLLLAV